MHAPPPATRHGEAIPSSPGSGQERTEDTKRPCCLPRRPFLKSPSSLKEAQGGRPSPLPILSIPHTWNSTTLLLARSALLPASAMTMLGLACLCNSFTQFLARANVSWGDRAGMSKGQRRHPAQGCSLEKLQPAGPRCLRCHQPEYSGETPPHNRENVPTPHPGTRVEK